MRRILNANLINASPEVLCWIAIFDTFVNRMDIIKKFYICKRRNMIEIT